MAGSEGLPATKLRTNSILGTLESPLTDLSIVPAADVETSFTNTITDLIEVETELLTVNVNYYSSRKDFILNYFNILALEGSIIKLFDKYLPNYN